MNDYEELKRKGYTEEEIKVILSQYKTVSIEDAPMGEKREDKRATIIDPDLGSKRTSNVMLGYNKRKIQLPSGSYINVDDLFNGMVAYLSENGENRVLLSRKTGKRTNPEDLVATVIDTLLKGPGFNVGNNESKITNQETSSYVIRGDDKARTFMLGNQGFNLPNGEWVSIDDLQGSLREYVMLKPPQITSIPVPGTIPIDPNLPTVAGPEKSEGAAEKSENEVHAVTKKDRKKFVPIVVPIVVATMLLSACKIAPEEITTFRQETTASYNVVSQEELSYPSLAPDEVVETVVETIDGTKTGDAVAVSDGVKYYRTSNQEAIASGEVAFGIVAPNQRYDRNEGTYSLDYVIIYDADGNRLNATFDEGVIVQEFVNDTLSNVGLSEDEATIMYHISGQLEDAAEGKVTGATGWVYADEIEITFKSDTSTNEATINDIEDVQTTIFVEGDSYSGIQEDYDGTITFQNAQGEDVTIKLVDVDGNQVDLSTRLLGSDGSTYLVENLDVQENTVEETTTIGKKKVSFDIKNIQGVDIAGTIAASVLGTAIITTALNAKKKKEEKKTYTTSQSEYQATSSFSQVGKTEQATHQIDSAENSSELGDDVKCR